MVGTSVSNHCQTCWIPTSPPGFVEGGRCRGGVKHEGEGRVSRATTHRHTQSNKVWETLGVMSLCGAIRGCGLLYTGWTDKLSLPGRKGQESPSWTDSHWLHSAWLTNNPAAHFHSPSPSLSLSLVHFYSGFKQEIEGKQLLAPRSENTAGQL